MNTIRDQGGKHHTTGKSHKTICKTIKIIRTLTRLLEGEKSVQNHPGYLVVYGRFYTFLNTKRNALSNSKLSHPKTQVTK